jgi:hypothetical protein
MEKFVYIPVTGLGNQLVSVTGIKLIDEASSTATATTIHYNDGTTTTLTHAADTAFSVLLAMQNAVTSALTQSWTNVAPLTVSLNVAVSGIANA